jgi:hypothetical protein
LILSLLGPSGQEDKGNISFLIEPYFSFKNTESILQKDSEREREREREREKERVEK